MTDGEKKIINWLRPIAYLLMAIYLMLMLMLLSGCITRIADYSEYDRETGKRIKHVNVLENNFLGIASSKGLEADIDVIKVRIAERLDKPDPESIKAVSDGMLNEIFKRWSVL